MGVNDAALVLKAFARHAHVDVAAVDFALARAAFGAPRIVLLDEPAAYLDEAGEAAVLGMIDALSRAGTAVVFTSHREGLLRAARRVLTLQGGQLSLAAGPAAPARIAVAA